MPINLLDWCSIDALGSWNTIQYPAEYLKLVTRKPIEVITEHDSAEIGSSFARDGNYSSRLC